MKSFNQFVTESLSDWDKAEQEVKIVERLKGMRFNKRNDGAWYFSTKNPDHAQRKVNGISKFIDNNYPDFGYTANVEVVETDKGGGRYHIRNFAVVWLLA